MRNVRFDRATDCGVRTRDITPEALSAGAPVVIASATCHFRNWKRAACAASDRL